MAASEAASRRQGVQSIGGGEQGARGKFGQHGGRAGGPWPFTAALWGDWGMRGFQPFPGRSVGGWRREACDRSGSPLGQREDMWLSATSRAVGEQWRAGGSWPLAAALESSKGMRSFRPRVEELGGGGGWETRGYLQWSLGAVVSLAALARLRYACSGC